VTLPQAPTLWFCRIRRYSSLGWEDEDTWHETETAAESYAAAALRDCERALNWITWERPDPAGTGVLTRPKATTDTTEDM